MISDGIPDYRVDIRVRNNLLLRRMEAKGFTSVAALAEASGVTYSHLSGIIGLKRPPIDKRTGGLTGSALKLCATLDATPAELWPTQHLEESLPRNRITIEMSQADIATMIGHDRAESPEQLLLTSEAFDRGISSLLPDLPERERYILVRRFGLEGHEPETLEALAREMGKTKERIRQLEHAAIRRLRYRLKHQKKIESLTDLGVTIE